MTLHEFYNKIKSLEIEKAKEDAVIENKEKIVNLNRAQLRLGLDNTDHLITPRYSEQYYKRKRKLTSYMASTGSPDLYLTGAFHKEMDVIVEDGKYEIISWDEKSGFLNARYDKIFGLIKENIEIAQVFVSRSFVNLLKDKLIN